MNVCVCVSHMYVCVISYYYSLNECRAAEMQRQSMIAACMTPPARERLARIAIVKPEKARFIEEYIVKNARTVRARFFSLYVCVYTQSCVSIRSIR